MNKQNIIIAVAVLILAVIGLFVVSQQNQLTAEEALTNIENDIDALQIELETVSEEIETETLTDTQAIERQAALVAQLESLDANIDAAADAGLTLEERTDFVAELSDFSQLLILYGDELLHVDTRALHADPSSFSGGQGTIAEVIQDIEQTIEANSDKLRIDVDALDISNTDDVPENETQK